MTDTGWEVVIDAGASEEEVEGISTAFQEVGVDASVLPGYVRMSEGDLPWIIALTLPLNAFLAAFAAEAGKDAWAALKRLVTRIREARKGRHGEIVVRSRETSTVLNIRDNLPDEAYQALFELSAEQYEGAYLRWDKERGEWRDVRSGK